MSPGTEAFVIEAASHVSKKSFDRWASSTEADQYDEQLESFLAQNSAVSSSVKGNRSIDDVSVSVTRDINISLPPDFKTPFCHPVSIVTEAKLTIKLKNIPMEKRYKGFKSNKLEQIRKIERDFWDFILSAIGKSWRSAPLRF